MKQTMILKKNFISVFLSNSVTRFISFHEVMIEKNRYPFIIMNTDQSSKNSTHWWSFLDLHPRKNFFLFDSFWIDRFKEFIINNDRKTHNKILFGIEKFFKKDNKVTVVTLKFSMREYEKIRNGHRLTTATQDLLHLMYKFGNLHKINGVVILAGIKTKLWLNNLQKKKIYQEAHKRMKAAGVCS